MRTISTHDTYTAVVKEAWILLDTLHHEGTIFKKYIFEDIGPFVGSLMPLFGLLGTFARHFKAMVDPSTYMLCHLHAMDSSDSPLV